MDDVDNVLDDVDNQEEYVVDDVDKEEEERRERRSVELQELRLRMTRQREISMVDTRWQSFFGIICWSIFFLPQICSSTIGKQEVASKSG